MDKDIEELSLEERAQILRVTIKMCDSFQHVEYAIRSQAIGDSKFYFSNRFPRDELRRASLAVDHLRREALSALGRLANLGQYEAPESAEESDGERQTK